IDDLLADVLRSRIEAIFSEQLVCTVFLVGNLGVGKTTLTRLLLKADLDSPSFVLRQEYSSNFSCGPKTVAHWDFYRLKSFPLEIYQEDADLIIVEWPDKFPQSFKVLSPDILCYITNTHVCFVFSVIR
ncbi:MAG: tRNA (adenosine(37)-N6)-threonylcarbamoyltransferase complex ATPase subunit type 1 TsaE, partial [Deltaproteobacteria bacterium]|nr:tRNA (adenosine(37)-N6)-threonylcarbamoyltransferase complex ATPase subunit type 1 TsaE [Deltaproteobacteria bacterium]